MAAPGDLEGARGVPRAAGRVEQLEEAAPAAGDEDATIQEPCGSVPRSRLDELAGGLERLARHREPLDQPLVVAADDEHISAREQRRGVPRAVDVDPVAVGEALGGGIVELRHPVIASGRARAAPDQHPAIGEEGGGVRRKRKAPHRPGVHDAVRTGSTSWT
ncbi:MAG: hypothetical protein IPM79_39575 [Polyangiaceae bacterium]|nr:hypothetical protein [Polyangiaceae bacterium]